MKKIIISLVSVFIFYLFISSVMAKSLEISEDAIRIRVVPNSNSEYDQSVKVKVKNKLQGTMYNMLKDVKTSEDAKEVIENNLDRVSNDVEKVLEKEKFDKGYNVNFGYNYFPEKEYKGIKYKEGYYESLLVTLGEGKGDNWWCVLFPPLCLIEAEESTDAEYKSFVKEVIDKYFSNNKK